MSNSHLICKILAIDPGKTIGFALAELYSDKLVINDIGQHLVSDWNPYNSLPMYLVGLCNVLRVEDFVGNGVRSKESNHVLKMIGAFKFRGNELEIQVVTPTPGTRTKFIKKGQEIHLKLTGKKLPVHALDAFAHLLKECEDRGVDVNNIEIEMRDTGWI